MSDIKETENEDLKKGFDQGVKDGWQEGYHDGFAKGEEEATQKIICKLRGEGKELKEISWLTGVKVEK